MADKVYVIDTNIVLQSIQNVKNLSEDGKNIVVIPETVLVELEEKKKQIDELGFQAREFARFLAESKVKEVDIAENCRVVKLYNGSYNIHLMTKTNYESDIEARHITESNDKRIIETADMARSYYKGQKVIFVSIDVYARMFGLFKNLKIESLREDRSEVPQREFLKSIPLDSSYFNSLENMNIKKINPEHKIENFCYEFYSEDGNKSYAIVHNERILPLDENDFRGMKVKPVNTRQRFFMKAILSNLYNIVVIDAKAGSGKTLIAISSAMRLIDKGSYDKIVYVRNSIESLDKGADVGYLSGNDEKFRIYNMALYDTLEFIAKRVLKKTENKESVESINSKITEMMERYRIEKLWPGEARGRTLSDAIVILDEWQNSSENTTQLILSRLDDTCMAIVIGSNRQIDNLYLNKYNNGLTSLLKLTTKVHPELYMFAIDLQKAVRGKFAEFSERVYENKKQR
ncbi:MAG: PhoH family protein [Campylobacteraceae bacterium]|jgi:PhoH-like ATPase|nr:PhoH family protein [Campylobacteraceae bacterium]